MGNSHTYQPKELGGIPGAFKKLARACTQEVTLASTVDFSNLAASTVFFLVQYGAAWKGTSTILGPPLM